MKRTEPKIISEIIDGAINNSGMASTMNEQKVCFLWPEIVGPSINRYTTRRFVDSGVMHVYISSAPLKNELQFLRHTIVQQLNDAVGAVVINEIVIH